ncbi:hypothetical protein EDD86DRAFT_99118 [Gorgonomyces haynaldii]|nr:hypothetical protein EDD86DRAFT_99118 [Gorgonomyces haynaldii]
MTKLWVKFKTNNATQVSTEGCQNVDDFLKACRKELSPHFDSVATDELSLSTTAGGPPLQPDDDIPAHNSAETPLLISVAVKETEMVSMSYGKATMHFISEATGVEYENQVWENIPVDNTIEPAQEFVELFKKNCSVFEFGAEASRRTLIDLFLREVVAQFPDFMIICEYHMTLVNKEKKRRLNGNCDYTICHRGLRNLPHLVAIEAKVTNRETLLQCIGECASIHYRRKEAGMGNLKVYGIHSTGSIWKFVFIDENGSLFVSKEYQMNPENYVKEGFDRIYRLVYYVVKQSHINSPRTTPVGSLVSVNQ